MNSADFCSAWRRRLQKRLPSERRGPLIDLARPFADQIVLFGAGPLGKLTLSRLQLAGVEPLAFADSNSKLWGTRIEGIEVFSREEAVERFKKAAVFVVTIYNGSAVREQLRKAGCERVVPFAALWWKYADVFLPEFGVDFPRNLLLHISGIRACYDLVADAASRKEILDQLHWRYWLDDAADVATTYRRRTPISRTNSLRPAPEGEAYMDCGAFDGASIQAFLDHNEGPVKHIYATEPDPGSRELLDHFLATLPEWLRKNVTLWPYALGKER